MCYECQAISKTILHYRQIEKLTTDHATLDSIRILIAKLEADKAQIQCAATVRFEK